MKGLKRSRGDADAGEDAVMVDAGAVEFDGDVGKRQRISNGLDGA